MFYAQFVLSKKGPLAKIWLAAHWEKKLTKAQVYETDVEKAVNQILEPKVKMALRTTGHLLLGIVRIYSRKAKYLLADCNEAFLKIKMAFRPGQVDLPDDAREANYNTITLPEVFHDFDSALPDFNEMEFQQQLSLNQSRLDDITMKEDLPKASDGYDNEFGLGAGLDDFGDAAFGDEDLEPERDAISFANHNEPYSAHSTRLGGNSVDEGMGDLLDPIPDDFGAGMDVDEDFMGDIFNDETLKAMEKEAEAIVPAVITQDDSFQLESLDTTVVQGLEKHRVKRKRKLIVDENKNISGEDMKAQMSGSNDTIGLLDLAPPTKKLMHTKEICHPEKFFNAASSDALQSKHLTQMLCEYLIPHAREEDANARAQLLEELELARQAEIDEEEEREFTHLHTIKEQEEGQHILPDQLLEDNNVPSVSPIAFQNMMSPLQAPDSPPVNDKTKEKKDTSKKERKERSKTTDQSKFDDSVEDGEDQDEKRWSKRTHQVLHAINTKLKHAQCVGFGELTRGATRKSAAQKFYTLLALKKLKAIEIDQAEPYGEMNLVPGPQFKQCLT